MNRFRFVCVLLAVSACSAPGPTGRGLDIDDLSTTPVQRQERNGETTAVRPTVPTGESDPSRAADAFIAEHADEISADAATLRRRETQTHGEGSSEESTVVYEEEQDGHRVYGAQVRVIVRGGDVVYAGGITGGDDAELGEAWIDEARAFELFNNVTPESWTMNESELVAFNLGVLIHRRTRSVLSWMLDVRDGAEPWRVFIDAQTGEEILRLPRFGHALVRETYSHNTSPETLIYNNGVLVEGVTPTADATAADGFVETVYNYFYDTFERDSYDDAGATIRTDVDIAGLDNAMWDGEKLSFDPIFLSLDVLGHELGHAVVEYTANLEYAFESGALNESYADIFGEFAAGETSWLIGESTPYGTLRSFSDPTAHRQPAHYLQRFAYGSFDACSDTDPCTSADERCVTEICISRGVDEGGVHYNSGIPNYATYLMTDGGTGAETGIVVNAIGREKVEQLVYRTLTSTLGSSSGFEDFRFGLQTTALGFIENEEHGFTYEDCGAVLNAMAAVGIGEPDRDNDCFDDEVDNCPCLYNPEQNEDDCDGNEECGPQCNLHRTCGECDADEGCGWCDDTCTPSADEMECTMGSFDAACEGDTCAMVTSCGECTGYADCGWCEGACQDNDVACNDADGNAVPFLHSELCTLAECAMEDSCDTCMASASGCTWCDGRCTDGVSLDCQQGAPATCEVDCSATTCSDCTQTPGCGWGAGGCAEAGTEGYSTDVYLCFCEDMATCADCTNQGCAWDEGSCARDGSADAVTEGRLCEPEVTDPCGMAEDCALCAGTAGCGWGPMGCVSAAPGTPDVVTRAAECYDCTGLADCTSCATNGFCEWCPGSGCHNTYEEACGMPTPVLECG